MPFSALLATLDQACVRAFGDSSVITYVPVSGGPGKIITGIFSNPPTTEDSSPGVNAFLMVTNADLAFAGIVPVRGDLVFIGTNAYQVMNVPQDLAPSIKLQLRKQ
jgi:hypothetical protein